MSDLIWRLRDNGKNSAWGLYDEAADTIEQLAKEKEQAQREVSVLQQRVDELMAENSALHREKRELESENQALAAHVERLGDEITGIINDSVGLAGYHMNGDIASWQEFDIENILEQSPQTSLAEVRARVIRDFLESPLDFDIHENGALCEKLKQYESDLRNGKDVE